MIAQILMDVFPVANADLGRAFQAYNRRSSTTRNLFLFALVALAIIGLLVGLALWERRRKHKKVKIDAELILFRRLCRIHQLSAAETQLLQQLAESHRVARRADVFVDPTILETSAGRTGPKSKQYAQLYRSLFAAEPSGVK